MDLSDEQFRDIGSALASIAIPAYESSPQAGAHITTAARRLDDARRLVLGIPELQHRIDGRVDEEQAHVLDPASLVGSAKGLVAWRDGALHNLELLYSELYEADKLLANTVPDWLGALDGQPRIPEPPFRAALETLAALLEGAQREPPPSPDSAEQDRLRGLALVAPPSTNNPAVDDSIPRSRLTFPSGHGL